MKYLFTIIPLLFSSLLLAQDVNMQTATVNQCGGVFYDSGGEFGFYSDNEDFVLTICPENAGQKIQIDFTAFSTQLNQDIMTIYNGDSVTEPLFGQFSGTNSPGLVQATQDNTSGCITIQFVSNASGTIDGWAANISCLTPCQTINSQIDSASPTPNANNYIRVCPNEEITLTGSGVFSIDGTGATYEWDLGDGNTASGQTATFSYPDPGVYIVNLNIRDANTSIDPLGCENNNLINQVIQVATEPNFMGTEATNTTLCFGESTDITGEVEAVEFINDCTPPVSGITFLPDGNGVTYETSVTVDCYDSAQTLTDVNQLVSICLTMEHSYLGDLDIEIISPNGQVVRMHDQGGGSANLGIPWATGTVDGQSNNTTPGTGSQYCFVPTGSFPTLVGGIQAGGTFPDGNGPGTYTDSFVPAGNYSSVNPLDGLLGSPLNGDWTIRVVDNIGADNGHIFAWSIEFDPALQPPELSFTPVITSEAWDTDPTITNTVGNVITVQPTTAGQFCYTYRATDDFGCEYTEEVCIDVLPEIVTETPNNLFVCDTGSPPYIFDLDSNTTIVLASATNTSDLVVTYHNSLADADSDSAAIAGAGSYSGTDGETIFIRVEYLVSGCYEVLSFTLNVAGQPTINPVIDLELCDDVSNDGVEEFDLSLQSAAVLGSQPSTDYAVTYYLNFADADSGTNALPSSYTNTMNPQPIFVRVENVGDSNCYNSSATAVFDLVVNTRAIANTPTNMVVCDDPSNDGLATFDLSTQESDILGGQDPSIYNVSFHNSQSDADSNLSAISTSYPNSTSNQETIYVRVEDSLHPDCYSTTSFDLVVDPLPQVVAVPPLQVCDDDMDGFVSFPLDTKVAELLNGQTGVEVSFHETLVGADTATAEVFDGYTNTAMTAQTLFVRLENTTTT
ncbi:PKD domain-containing protein, partial [uncultured Winogradskyella sp.]|uniref:PKD domain-containing protein n=1 Tax=uncultured Winogradskyella sp. TaxID=395353 RepID=UPI00260FBD40